jgi:outer membrane protein OmpA-like peptidoglycan-associated protein
MWFNDFDTRKVAGGGDFYLRYGVSRRFSFGIMGSYDALQSSQSVLFPGTPLQYDYMEDKGISADLVAWYHVAVSNRVAPYFYIGVGGYQYKRKVTNNLPYPQDKTYSTIHIPAGFGLDVMFSRYVGFNLDFGGRLMNDLTDNWTGSATSSGSGALDWYATGKAGFNFYVGSSGSDDPDNDGLTNDEEEDLSINPDVADTDGDGLRDGEEVNIYKTDPLKTDSDGDSLKDGEEANTFKTSGNRSDSDDDGLNDGEEVHKYKTDPLRKDTDDDGLTDGDEVSKQQTDPLKADTDVDGLKDGDEVATHQTHPLKADTDGGSVYDGQEITNGTNPLDKNDDVPKPPPPPIEIGKAIILEGITFATGKATIEPGSEETLLQALKTLRENPSIAVEVRGYTDNVGKASTNRQLSQRRAEAVRNWLIRFGILAIRLTAKGYGQEDPIGDNATVEGRSKNRRIEFFRTK